MTQPSQIFQPEPGFSPDSSYSHILSTVHALSAGELLAQLKVNPQEGLAAEQVKERIEKYGRNVFEAAKKERIWILLLRQLNSLIVWVLLFAAAFSFVTDDWLEGYAIMGVILINALMGFALELRARQSMQALRQMDKTFAKVIRNGSLQEISSENITIGDILFVEAGDVLPADARIIEASQLETDESALTGESLPVGKQVAALASHTPVAEQSNKLFKGTAVVKGNSKAVVVAVGLKTELGKITALVESAEDTATPLEKKLANLTKKLIWITLVLAAFYLVTGLMQQKDLSVLFKTSIALAVAAIPEGLSIVATIVLAIGMLRMAKKNVIVKRLAAVETLGGTNVIFTDKTGTLTYNRIEVNTICLNQQEAEVRSDLVNKKTKVIAGEAQLLLTESYQKLLLAGILCNNAIFRSGEQEAIQVGDPVETSLLAFGLANNSSKQDLEAQYPRMAEEAFSSETRLMATLHRQGEAYLVTAKGATEEMLVKCTSVLCQDEPEVLSVEKRAFWQQKSEALAATGLRVLAFAYKNIGSEPEGDFMDGLTLIGLIGFLDPPRTEVVEAMQACRQAGIKVIMVTGDHPATALTISHKVNLTHAEDNRVITGTDLESLQQKPQQKDKLLAAHVFARVSPAQKLDLIHLYQQQGDIVGMTGDGINDAPALKKADIGIAMGLKGTQVARETADIILKDDAFHSIVLAIAQGRIIFENIRKFVVYLLSCNLSEVMVVTAFGFIAIASPLTPLQILFLNLVTDVFPALALGMGKGNPFLMKRPPRHPKAPIITNRDWFSVVSYALFISVCVMAAALYAYYTGVEAKAVNNIVFFSLALAQLLHVFGMAPAREPFFSNEITKNPYVWGALGLCVLILLLTYVNSLLKEVLSVQTLEKESFIIIAVAGALPVVMVRILNLVQKNR